MNFIRYFMLGMSFVLAKPLSANLSKEVREKSRKLYEQRKQKLEKKLKNPLQITEKQKQQLKELLDKLLHKNTKPKKEEKVALLESLELLKEQLDMGSIDAYQFACELFETSQIFYLDEAIAVLEEELDLNPYSETYEIQLCGKYIGDDGLEYDDGLPEEEQTFVPFYSLPIHQWEKKVIDKLITYMAEKSLAQLLVDRKEMEKRGDQIFHVHPLRFLAHVMSDAYLKSCVSQFKGKPFVWSHFIDGYAQKMRQEAAKDNLLIHLEEFANYLKKDVKAIYSFVNEGNFEGLVLYLIEA